MRIRNITIKLIEHDDGRTTGEVCHRLSVIEKTAAIHALAAELPEEILEMVLTKGKPFKEMRE